MGWNGEAFIILDFPFVRPSVVGTSGLGLIHGTCMYNSYYTGFHALN